MKFAHLLLICLLALVGAASFAETEKERLANTVILTAEGVANLRLEAVTAEETVFEETVFALGRIGAAPGHRAVVSSRVPGRVVTVAAHIDRPIAKDAEVLVLESRQAGDPPPSVRLLAPLAGMVTVVNVVPGSPVEQKDALVEIMDLSEVHAVAAVPEHLIGKLRPGQRRTSASRPFRIVFSRRTSPISAPPPTPRQTRSKPLSTHRTRRRCCAPACARSFPSSPPAARA